MARPRHPDRSPLRHAVLLAGALALGGCVKPALVVTTSEQAALGPGEALLVVESEGEVEWHELVVRRDGGGRFTLALAGRGDRIGVFKLPAGDYTLIGSRLRKSAHQERGFAKEPRFAVKPGYLNYIGTLSFEFDDDGGLYYHWRNRSGRVLTNFRALLPASAAALPFVYVGDEGDDWSSRMSEGR